MGKWFSIVPDAFVPDASCRVPSRSKSRTLLRCIWMSLNTRLFGRACSADQLGTAHCWSHGGNSCSCILQRCQFVWSWRSTTILSGPRGRQSHFPVYLQIKYFCHITDDLGADSVGVAELLVALEVRTHCAVLKCLRLRN